jgi:hypothetical protein
MDPPDHNLSFDFFEDEPPPAARPRRGGLPERPRGPVRPGRSLPPREFTPLVRLAVLVLLVLFLLFVFGLLLNSCAAESRHDADSGYMNAVSTIAQQSASDGARAVSVLTTQGLTVPQMVQKLEGLAASEQQNVQAAQALAAPGRLRDENASLVEALQLRVLGLDGLANEFRTTVGTKVAPADEALALSRQAYRLLASDIVWDDLFRDPAETRLAADGVSGVSVPESHFLANPNLIVTPRAMSLVVSRISAGTTPKGVPAGLHGTNLVSVQALSNGASGAPQTLVGGSLNTVTTSSSLVFRVTIHDGGNFQEVQIPVQLTIGRPAGQGGPITRRATVQLIDPGQDASVVFSDLGQVPFAAQTTLSVDVGRVPGETDVANNSAQYNVIFSLPG